jgi:hypothetical protein
MRYTLGVVHVVWRPIGSLARSASLRSLGATYGIRSRSDLIIVVRGALIFWPVALIVSVAPAPSRASGRWLEVLVPSTIAALFLRALRRAAGDGVSEPRYYLLSLLGAYLGGPLFIVLAAIPFVAASEAFIFFWALLVSVPLMTLLPPATLYLALMSGTLLSLLGVSAYCGVRAWLASDPDPE